MIPKNFNQDLFNRIIDDDNFYKAYKQTQKGKSKYKIDAMKFALDETYNLIELKQSLIDETYEFGGYETFPVFEPKCRIINAPRYKDKIVQIAINGVLKEVYYPCFIFDSYACIDNKGTHKCVDKIQKFIKRAKWEYGNDAYIIKIDIKKFFYSIDREVLKTLLPKKIKCKKTLRLIFKIIDSADVIDVFGLPLGNTLSQISANICLNKLDQYCKRKLGLKHYIRYADDTIIIVKDKDEAKKLLKLIEEFLNVKLHLFININKTKIFPVSQGVNGIGFKIQATHRLLRNSSKKKIKRKTKKIRHLLDEGKITIEKVEQILSSWQGHAEHGSSHNFIQKLIDKNDYIYLNKKGVLKVNKEKLKKEGDNCADKNP